jgi:hypothetical protein
MFTRFEIRNGNIFTASQELGMDKSSSYYVNRLIFYLSENTVSLKSVVVWREVICCLVYIQGVSEGIVNILGGGSMDYSE